MTTVDTTANPTFVPPAYAANDTDDDFVIGKTTSPRARRMTSVLLVFLLMAGAFGGGVLAQKQWGTASADTPASAQTGAANRNTTGGLGNFGGGGSPPEGGTPPSGGFGGPPS